MTATGGASGNAVTFTIDASAAAVCSISSSTVWFTGVGTCVIDANQLGNTNYAAAAQAQQSFSVGQATPTITFGTAPTPAYLGDNFTASATTNSNGALSYSYVSGPCAQVSGGTFSSSGAGVCVVKASTATTTNFSAGSNTQNITIGKATTSILYTGSSLVIIGNTLTLSAALTPTTGCTGAVSYSLDKNPLTGVSGTYPLSGTFVSTAYWLEGTYVVTVTYAGDLNCKTSYDDTGTVTVATGGDSASGGGWYSQNGRVNFGFVVQQVPNTSPIQYKGQIVLIQKSKWRVKGALTQYVKSNGTGFAAGSGSLDWWNTTLNGGLGGWQLATPSVTFTITFTATTTTAKTSNPGTVGITINYTPTGSQPQLPNSSPQPLKGGQINVN